MPKDFQLRYTKKFRPLWLFVNTWVCLLLIFSAAARAQGIPAESLTALKAATVLVLVDTTYGPSSGSGFLMSKEGDVGYIATNAHVLAIEPGEGRRVRVVFNSGIPGQESVLAAEVAAEDEHRDLAILRVRSATLPEPLKLSSPQPPRETAQVWVLGFPFGEMLATSKLHPAITITTGTITSLRLNDYGKVMRVQVDADINEGNSGGPIVDATGGLVGIATEKIEDTKIGLGLPPSELAEMLRGRLKEVGFHIVTNAGGNIEYRVVAILIDPMQQVRSVSVFLIPEPEGKQLTPDAQGVYGPAAPKMWEFPLKLNGREYSGPVPLKNPAMTDDVLWQQIRLELADGTFKWTQPARLVVPFSRGAASRTVPAANAPAANVPAVNAPAANAPATNAPATAGQPVVPGQPAAPNAPKRPTPKADDWLGGAVAPQPGAGTAAGTLQVAASDKLLLKEPQTEADATFRVVDVGSGVTPTMQWSSDGKFVYLLEESGTLHKVAVPEFKEEKVAQLGQQTKFMVLSAAGIAVGLPLLQEVWLLAPDSLKLLKRIPVGGLSNLTGSPLLNTVYAIQNEGISIVDLVAGQVTAQVRGSDVVMGSNDGRLRHVGFKFATVTPDGQYMLSESLECLTRFRINGNQFILEEMGPRIGQNSQKLEISPDSNYVALPSGGGNYRVQGHPQTGPYSTFVYKVTDLQNPVITISSGAYPKALAFDKAAGLLYAQKFDAPLIAFTPAGLMQKTYHLGVKRGDDVKQILPHPQGRKVLVLVGTGLIWVELGTAAQP